ncbi:S41 family peptidase [Luteimonas vadosa]|uniref:Tail specific protease domain-containing protein n=1 Tax=Luteimonas vadosa TaxID=1165507 RepID=A0ABP9E493_9GAMM
MQEVAPDKHLRLDYEPDREYAPAMGAARIVAQGTDDGGAVRQVVRTGRMDGRSVEQIAYSNFGVARVEHLPGNIGYLKLTRFVPAYLSRDTLRAAIALLAHSDAVVIDLRGNIGGAPDAVGELLSPFFPASGGTLELHAAENRAEGIRSAVTTDPVLARPALATAPLYVLTDKRTASAAEMFAYAARRAGRATLVGETTSGAGNGATRQSVGNGFVLTLSEWRILTGPGWEGVGVAPDLPVAAEDALDRALELASEAIAGQTT